MKWTSTLWISFSSLIGIVNYILPIYHSIKIRTSWLRTCSPKPPPEPLLIKRKNVQIGRSYSTSEIIKAFKTWLSFYILYHETPIYIRSNFFWRYYFLISFPSFHFIWNIVFDWLQFVNNWCILFQINANLDEKKNNFWDNFYFIEFANSSVMLEGLYKKIFIFVSSLTFLSTMISDNNFQHFFINFFVLRAMIASNTIEFFVHKVGIFFSFILSKIPLYDSSQYSLPAFWTCKNIRTPFLTRTIFFVYIRPWN